LQRNITLSSGGPVNDSTLNIVVIDENPVRAAILEDGLRDAGYTRVTRIGEMTNLLRRLTEIEPEVILIDLENPSRDVLEQMFQVSRIVRRPVAMFVDQSDSAMIQAAVDAGVSAYIVGGLQKERVRPILDMTISRFHAFSRLQDELDEARSKLAERKVIERAKGILMKQRGMAEEDAYRLLRETAMTQKKKLADIAEGVVMAAKLLGS
jgi:response regulator NasT